MEVGKITLIHKLPIRILTQYVSIMTKRRSFAD